MALTQANLKAQLVALGIYDNETDVINAWSGAWNTYFGGATANSVTIAAAARTAAVTAMKTALVGMSVANATATKIQAGIVAYWGALVPATAWPGCLAIVAPPTLPTIAAALTSAFSASTSGNKSKADAMDAIATAIHSKNTGGIATIPPPPGTTYPIL